MDLEEPTVHLFFQNIRSERVKKSKFNIFINTKKVSINDRSFLYGDGLFETILVRDGKIYYLKDHYSRLKKGSKLLKILIPDFKLTELSIKKCINKTKNCIVKIIISRGDNKFGYQIPNGIVPNIYFNKIDCQNIQIILLNLDYLIISFLKVIHYLLLSTITV